MSDDTFDPRLVLADPPASAPTSIGPPGWIVPAIIGSALLMSSLESTVMSNALPSIARALHEEPLRLNMAISMYLLSSAVFLPVSGWVADKFGAKRIFLASMILFAISSAGCGLAGSFIQLILARIFQGASAAMMVPVARLVLLRMTPKHELVGAMSIFTMPALVGPVVGPILGGFIVTYFNWRWIFFINLPIAVIAVILVRACVPDVKEREVPPIDGLGIALTGVGLASMMFGFENLGRNFLPAWQITALFVVSLACFAVYWRHATGNRHAIIDLAVFRIGTFNAATVGGGFMRISIGAMPFLLAMLLQIGFGMSALTAGLMTFLSSAGALVMKSMAPPLLRRFGFRTVLLVNGAITGLSFAIYTVLTPGMPHWAIMLLLASGGFFRSLQFTALGSLVFADIDESQVSRASTTSSMCQQLVQSMGVGLAAAFVHFVQLARGEPQLTWQAISPGFLAVGAVSLISLPWFVRLPRNAGHELHAPTPVPAS
jgi:EmrB/QacA subfamily drug resistance transporter